MSVRNTMRPTIFSLYGRCPRPLCEKVIMSGVLFCQFNKKYFCLIILNKNINLK